MEPTERKVHNNIPRPPAGRPAVAFRLALLAGFGGVFLLMAFAGIDSLRIVHRIEASNIKSDQEFLKRNDTLERIRADFYLSGSYVRDYLLDPDAASAEAHLHSLKQLRTRIETALEEYSLGLAPDERAAFTDLKARFATYWQSIDPVLSWDSRQRRTRGFHFLTRDLVQRRIEVLRIAGRIGDLNERRLHSQEQSVSALFQSFRQRLTLILATNMGLGVLLAAGTVFYILKLENDLWRRYKEILHFHGELESLSARLLRAQEEERRSIARELHDEIGQSLTALLIDAGNASALVQPGQEDLRARLASIRKLAEGSVASVRNMSLLLRPSMLDDFGLIPALHWQAREMSRRTGVRVELSADDAPDSFSDEHKTCVYRVVQEALHNCARHAHATHVRIVARQEPTRLLLVIQDNGKGFDPRHVRGLGLLGMEERVRYLGGNFHLESEPGRGTLIKVELPLVDMSEPPMKPA
ncbi:MAG: hypothetical protein IANPNBLG_02800 [Bryobacteraceae bacterium]|nr:hypothetical protein [Bryobacteraceae bacterium]